MKAKPYQVKALIPQLKQDFAGALVFGTDEGLVQETAEKIGKMIVPNLNDDLTVIKITSDKIKENKTFLADESNAASFFGGRKLIWVKNADNTVAEAVQTCWDNLKTDTFTLLSAGNLSKASALRTLCEQHPKVLAVACYAENDSDIAGFIQETLAEYGVSVHPRALPLLVERLRENRMMTRQELNKLVLYLGDVKTVTPDDVLAVVTDTTDSSSDALCMAVAGGNMTVADKEYNMMLARGENVVSIIRMLSMYFNRLLAAAETYEQAGPEAAVKHVLKPAQFRWTDAVKQQLKVWKKGAVLKVLDLLMTTERQAKTTGLPDTVILSRVILQIAGVAQRHR